MPNHQIPGPQMPGAMQDETQRALLQADREDLLAVLTIRFGAVPAPIRMRIDVCNNPETLERWILVAANVPDWVTFFNDLNADPNTFKIVGDNYEPNYTESGAKSASRSTREPQAPDEARKED
jgi:hypothetical protein